MGIFLLYIGKDFVVERIMLITIEQIKNSKASAPTKVVQYFCIAMLDNRGEEGHKAWNEMEKIIGIEGVDVLSFSYGFLLGSAQNNGSFPKKEDFKRLFEIFYKGEGLK